MPDYTNGKIYTIRSHQTEQIYIGSTVQTLAQRLGKHRSTFKQYKNGLRGNVTSFEILQYDDHYIELLELFPCARKDELLRREGQLIREHNNCVNKCIAGRTYKEYNRDNKEKMKEYYQNNKEKIKEYTKEYYQNNKEKIAEYRRVNKEKIKEYTKEYRQNNKEKTKQYYRDNKEQLAEYYREYRQNNKERIRERDRLYRNENKEKYNKKINCTCGVTVSARNLKRHEQSKKHKKHLESLTI